MPTAFDNHFSETSMWRRRKADLWHSGQEVCVIAGGVVRWERFLIRHVG